MSDYRPILVELIEAQDAYEIALDALLTPTDGLEVDEVASGAENKMEDASRRLGAAWKAARRALERR